MDVLTEGDISTYEKCGEVMSFGKADKRSYALKCLFCDKSFMALFTFVDHIEEFHTLAIKQELDQAGFEEDMKNIPFNTPQTNCEENSLTTTNEGEYIQRDGIVKVETVDQDCINTEELNRLAQPWQESNTMHEVCKDRTTTQHQLEMEQIEINITPKEEFLDDDELTEVQNLLDPYNNTNEISCDEDDQSEIEYIVKIEDEEDFGDYNSLEELKLKLKHTSEEKSASTPTQLCGKSGISEKPDDHDLQNNCTELDCVAGGITSDADPLDIRIKTDREFTKALITAFKQIPLLWNVAHSNFKNVKGRLRALKKIADNLATQFGTRYEVFDIDKCLRTLLKNYLADLAKVEIAESKKESHATCWYFEEFDVIRNKLRLVQEHEKAHPNDASSLLLLSLKQSVQLLQIYKSFPCLWNTRDIGYHSKNQRRIATKAMLAAIEEKMNIKLSNNNLKNRLYRLRLTCTKEKIEKLKCERFHIKHLPKCKFYSHLSFLYDHVSPFKCPHCVKSFPTFELCLRHIALHTGKKQYTCPVCELDFNYVKNLNSHIQRFHQPCKHGNRFEIYDSN